MTKFFITEFDQEKFRLKQLFPLARVLKEFVTSAEDTQDNSNNFSGYELTDSSAEADVVLISEPLSHNCDKSSYEKISEINDICAKKGSWAYAYIQGDYAKVHPFFSNVIYFRLGGFRKQLNPNNQALFPILSDQLKKIYDIYSIDPREKKEKPTVGFCGHASSSKLKFLYEKSKLLQINGLRILQKDFYLEPLFSSAYERHLLLKILESADSISTNFIFRKRYRAGAVSKEDRHTTTLEYYDNIINSDYILCLRGSGNFSVRFYEALMMGRIPVFVNTDCLLPLEDEIDWKKHVVWVEWKDRKNIVKKVIDFHQALSSESFTNLQIANRQIWEKYLNVKYILKKISRDSIRKNNV